MESFAFRLAFGRHEGRGRPSVSRADQPKVRAAAPFQPVTVPSRATVTIGLGDASMTARSWLLRGVGLQELHAHLEAIASR